MKRILILLMLLPMLSGCPGQADHGDEANKLVTAAHQAIITKDWHSVIPLYDKEFLSTHSPAAWERQVTEMTAPMGKLNNIKSTFERYDPRVSGDYYQYGFILQFEHGSISETLTVYKASDKDPMTISGHNLKILRHS